MKKGDLHKLQAHVKRNLRRGTTLDSLARRIRGKTPEKRTSLTKTTIRGGRMIEQKIGK